MRIEERERVWQPLGLQTWKWPHITKGALTWIPPLNRRRKRHLSTGGTNDARYCYSVWLRHLVILERCGFKIKGARVGELGPGESIGTGLAALLSGAEHYVGLDVVAFSPTNLELIFESLVQLYRAKERIPDNLEFPRIKPAIGSYDFPDYAVEWSGFDGRVERIRAEISAGLHRSRMMKYEAPWTSIADIDPQTLDLIFSQAVLEYVSPLQDGYRAMAVWLKKGQYASHVIDLSAHYLSPLWNGHWAYSDLEWRLACGRREFFLNREPQSAHLTAASEAGFEVVSLHKDYGDGGLKNTQLAPRYRDMDREDLRTRGATVVLRRM